MKNSCLCQKTKYTGQEEGGRQKKKKKKEEGRQGRREGKKKPKCTVLLSHVIKLSFNLPLQFYVLPLSPTSYVPVKLL